MEIQIIDRVKFVLLSDHLAAMKEKDEEIAALQRELDRARGTKTPKQTEPGGGVTAAE